MIFHRILTCAFLATATLSLIAAPKETPAVKPVETATPEELLAKIEDLMNAEPPESLQPDQKEYTEFQLRTYDAADQLIAKFRKLYPDNPLRWNVLSYEANMLEGRESLGLPQPAGAKSAAELYAKVIAAPDAPKELRQNASTARLVLLSDQVEDEKLTLAEWEKLLAEHLAAFPESEDNLGLIQSRVELIASIEPARLSAVLAELAKSTNAEIAAMAKERIESGKAIAELMSKPLELKFKSVDGSDVDVEKLRGKVVLIDFWATWCGPCMKELPDVITTYEKLHGKGLEIIGISLDEEEDALKKVIKDKKIPWPQYFDGKGWENPYVKKYGIDSIPTMWLINKKGMVVDTEPDDELEKKIEKLLAE